LYINPDGKEVQKCILEILRRDFTGDGFKLNLLVPKIPGTPAAAELAAAFGEANDCRLDATTPIHSTAEQDRRYYTHLQRALQAMQVVAAPDLDVGFAGVVKWFAEGITAFVADGTPMCMATRAISRFLLQAQRQRQQEMMFADDSGEDMLCFKETNAITVSKEGLEAWSRDAQIDKQIQWGRCFEQAKMERGMNDRGRHGGRMDNGRGATKVFDFPIKREENDRGGSRQGERKDNTGFRYNRIEKRKWMLEYGETRVNGKVVILCWYHCNRPGGCVKPSDCRHDHTKYPEQYKGKALDQCSSVFQQEVLKKCTGA
jgi:hypothetical protein